LANQVSTAAAAAFVHGKQGSSLASEQNRYERSQLRLRLCGAGEAWQFFSFGSINSTGESKWENAYLF